MYLNKSLNVMIENETSCLTFDYLVIQKEENYKYKIKLPIKKKF